MESLGLSLNTRLSESKLSAGVFVVTEDALRFDSNISNPRNKTSFCDAWAVPTVFSLDPKSSPLCSLKSFVCYELQLKIVNLIVALFIAGCALYLIGHILLPIWFCLVSVKHLSQDDRWTVVQFVPALVSLSWSLSTVTDKLLTNKNKNAFGQITISARVITIWANINESL